MERTRASSLDEFVSWYLERNRRKHAEAEVPPFAEARLALMQEKHKDKLRPWFLTGLWFYTDPLEE